jgi:hypothetical protein
MGNRDYFSGKGKSEFRNDPTIKYELRRELMM